MTLGEVIKKYRIENNLSLREFASMSGLSFGYIRMLEQGKNSTTGRPINPSFEMLTKSANAMRIDIDYLINILNDDTIFLTSDEDFKKQLKKDSVPIYVYGTIHAGIPNECIEEVIDTEEIPISMLKGGKSYFGLKIQGNSMYPNYLDGDTVIFEKKEDCENGQDCAILIGNEGTFKRVTKTDNGVILKPINPEYDPIVCKEARIIGIAREIRRKV